MKIKRENWKGKTKKGYYSVARDSFGHFIRTKKWTYEYTQEDFIEETRKPEKEAIEEVPEIENCYHVHAKLKMTKGWKGGSIEMEAYMYVRATDSETAKDKLATEIDSRFTSGESPFTETTDIRLFANEISCSEMEKEGLIKWRDTYLAERKKWRQETLTSY